MVIMRFLLVGVVNTLVGLSTIYFAMYFLQLEIVQANALGYSVGGQWGQTLILLP